MTTEKPTTMSDLPTEAEVKAIREKVSKLGRFGATPLLTPPEARSLLALLDSRDLALAGLVAAIDAVRECGAVDFDGTEHDDNCPLEGDGDGPTGVCDCAKEPLDALDAAILTARSPSTASEMLERVREEGRREGAAVIDSAPTENFLEAVKIEAAHQRHRWGEAHDDEKTPADWMWTVGALIAKAVHLPEKRLHHIVTSAAMLANWHLRVAPVCAACRGVYPHGGPRCEAVARGIRICPTCDCPCDPDGPCQVCVCDAACRVCARPTEVDNSRLTAEVASLRAEVERLTERHENLQALKMGEQLDAARKETVAVRTEAASLRATIANLVATTQAKDDAIEAYEDAPDQKTGAAMQDAIVAWVQAIPAASDPAAAGRRVIAEERAKALEEVRAKLMRRLSHEAVRQAVNDILDDVPGKYTREDQARRERAEKERAK